LKQIEISRRTILVVSLSLIVATLLLSWRQRGRPIANDEGLSSTMFADEIGTMAAYLLLDELTGTAERLRRPYAMTRALEEGSGTLIVTDPLMDLEPVDHRALMDWISGGGQLILALETDWLIRSEREEEEAKDSDEPFLAQLGIALADGGTSSSEGAELLIRGEGFTGEQLETLVEGDPHPLAAALGIGAGRIVLIGDSEVFSNARLNEEPGNGVWLYQTCASWGGPILFDEIHQRFGDRMGFTESIWIFLRSPWGFPFVQLAICGVLVLIGPLSRFGPIREPRANPRHDPLELVRARAGLFRAAGANQLCFQMIHRHLRMRYQPHGRGGDPFAQTDQNRERADRSERLERYGSIAATQSETEKTTAETLLEASVLAGELIEELHHDRIRTR